ncbi:type II toxin-antitoxin system RelE/ParE family toxin [Thiomicrospira microaerophila]|uniref:type II toxin-antitoxin system RelE/ParE family toxin n=1 Tax=Thiomicrospira microaerophila TaxID=406020 RepID=UPI0006986362|nr:type II toxin-antitoxin system RelE/ParE family toxin [Thiomicrospira microaerophila]
MSSTKPGLVLAPVAQSDLKEIYRYTVENWGMQQAQNYLDHIKQSFKTLLENPNLGRERSELGQNVRAINCQKHIIFYRYLETELQIIRVLHGRQDPARHVLFG